MWLWNVVPEAFARMAGGWSMRQTASSFVRRSKNFRVYDYKNIDCFSISKGGIENAYIRIQLRKMPRDLFGFAEHKHKRGRNQVP